MGRSGYAPTPPWLLLADQGSSTLADLLHVAYGACVDGDGVVALAAVEGAFVEPGLVVAITAVEGAVVEVVDNVAVSAAVEGAGWVDRVDPR